MNTPTNSTALKSAIEAAANVKINLSHYHCTGFEGYATAIPATPTVRFSKSAKIWFDMEKTDPKVRRDVSTYDHPTKEVARLAALLELANVLDMEVPAEWEQIIPKILARRRKQLLGE